MSHLDYSVFQMINHLAVTDRFLNPLMIFLSEKAEYLFFVAIILYWFIQKSKNRRMIVEVVISACVALAINAIIGMFFYRDRPFVAHHVTELIPHAKNASFPSDHATAGFVIATAIWIWRKFDGWIWLILAAAISISRVWTGVHYPLDIIAGMIIGCCVALTVHNILKRSEVLNKLVIALIGLYEKVENSILKKRNVQN